MRSLIRIFSVTVICLVLMRQTLLGMMDRLEFGRRISKLTNIETTTIVTEAQRLHEYMNVT